MDVAGPIDGFLGIWALVRDADGVIVAEATWRQFSLRDLDTTEAITMHLSLSFAYDLCFLNL